MSEKTTSQKANPRGQKGGVGLLTIAANRILIHGQLTSRTLPARGDKPERVMHDQAAIIIGGSRPINFDRTVFEREDGLKEGVYMFGRNALRMGKYDLEINQYEPWVFVREMTEDERAMFENQTRDLEDLLG